MQTNFAIATQGREDEAHRRDAPCDAMVTSAYRPEERAIELCEGLIDIAAALFSVSGKELRRPGRTNLGVARVRQIAMYVAHVILRLNMTDIGRGFGRDRTTVLHACHLVEDLRDDGDFDRMVAMTEKVVLAAYRNRLGL